MRIEAIRSLNNQKLKHGSYKFNRVAINPTNSKEHEDTKWEVGWILAKAGKKFVSEIPFKDGNRPDLYCLDNDAAYEVVNSEGEKSKKSKTVKYKSKVVFIKAGLGGKEIKKIVETD